MSGTIAAWNRGEDITLDAFPGLLFRDRYLRIYGFLRDEGLVRDGLRRLDQATSGMGQDAFRTYLAAEEKRFGFAGELGVIREDEDLIKASRFWLYLIRGQAMVDIGAGDADHGVLIHRVQWVLVGQWTDRTGAIGTASGVAELYRNLGAANGRALTQAGRQLLAGGGKLDTGAQGPRIFDSVWDAVFDAFFPRQNGTVPEYLFRYIRENFSGLFARMQWA